MCANEKAFRLDCCSARSSSGTMTINLHYHFMSYLERRFFVCYCNGFYLHEIESNNRDADRARLFHHREILSSI